jgi:hypothetical protein
LTVEAERVANRADPDSGVHAYGCPTRAVIVEIVAGEKI